MKFKENNLYLVTSQEFSQNNDSFEIAKESIIAGIDILQMREKTKIRSELVSLGLKLSGLCKDNGVMFIVNDDPYLAKEVGASGVHLGQEDVEKYPIQKVREIIGIDKIIGISTHSVEQFVDADKKDVDYIAFGPIFSTKTKSYNIGDDEVEKVLSLTKKPIVFIGGINLKNVEIILKKGAKNIAVIRAITESANVTESVKEFKTYINNFEGGKSAS